MDNALLHNLFLDKVSSDVQICVSTTSDCRELVVPAHKLVLRTSSAVFKTMLDTDNFLEGRTGIVNLKVKGDMEDAILFLRYLYTSNLEQVDLNVYISLLQTAHMYEVDNLVTLCSQRIVDCVTPLNACKILVSLEKVAPENLLIHCRQLMLDFAFLIFKKDLHLSLNEKTMSSLLKDDKLNILNEEQALGALWRWGCARWAFDNQNNEGIAPMIAKLLPLIRRHLLVNISSGSRWFALWNDYLSAIETSESNPSSETNLESRKPDHFSKATKFVQVACFSDVAHERMKTIVEVNCTSVYLFMFSADRDIFLSGFTVQILVGEKIQPEKSFRISLNQKDVTNLSSSKMVLVYQYTEKNIVKEPCLENPRPLPKLDNFFLYDILFEFNTPIFLLQNIGSHGLYLSFQSVPKPGIYLTSYKLTHMLNRFNQNLNIRAMFNETAIRQLYYFV